MQMIDDPAEVDEEEEAASSSSEEIERSPADSESVSDHGDGGDVAGDVVATKVDENSSPPAEAQPPELVPAPQGAASSSWEGKPSSMPGDGLDVSGPCPDVDSGHEVVADGSSGGVVEGTGRGSEAPPGHLPGVSETGDPDMCTVAGFGHMTQGEWIYHHTR